MVEAEDESEEEAPVQRYLRLKSEAAELEEEVAALAAAGGKDGEEGGEQAGGAGKMLWGHLAEEVQGLRAQLLGLAGTAPLLRLEDEERGGGEGGEITSIASAEAEADLAEALLRRVGLLALKDDEGKGEGRVKEEGGEGEVVYELYSNSVTSSSAASRAAALQALERRLATLEQAVLSSSAGGDEEGEEGLVLAARTLPLAEAVAKVGGCVWVCVSDGSSALTWLCMSLLRVHTLLRVRPLGTLHFTCRWSGRLPCWIRAAWRCCGSAWRCYEGSGRPSGGSEARW